MHAWEMTSTEIVASGEMNFNESEINIESFKGVLHATSLKSKSAQMDKNAYKTLNTTKHEFIEFEFKQIQAQNQQEGTVSAMFSVTIAGVTKDLLVQATVQPNDSGLMAISGTHAFKMSDFGIKPPSFMLGALKVGDDLEIDFKLNVKVSNFDSLVKTVESLK